MKRIYTFAAALLFLGACTSDGYTIRGNVEGLESPYVYLITFNGTHNVADSAKVEAGAFTFTGKTELPEVAYLSRDKEQPFVRFFLENARISIDGNLYNPNEVYPTGTAANEAMNAFNELTFNTSEAYGVTELEADKKQLVDRYKQQMRETIDRNRDNICGMIILAETGSMFFTPQEVLAEIDRFPAEWQQRTELTDLRKVMEQRLRTTVGQPYVDISAPNADGEAVSLKSVIENPANKYVLVDFWASWCGPCLREIPYLQADYEKYRKKGFEIYAVSLDDERDAWVKTIADKQMKWIQVCDFKAFDSPASLDYAVESIPSNFLRRPDRRRTAARQGPRREARRAVGEITGDGRPEAMCFRPVATGSAATGGPGSNNICAPTWDNPTATSRCRHPQATRCRCGRRWRTRPTSACSSISGLRGAAPA